VRMRAALAVLLGDLGKDLGGDGGRGGEHAGPLSRIG
jgi:hypothetical protein